jgi:hypothetical protein
MSLFDLGHRPAVASGLGASLQAGPQKRAFKENLFH